MTHRPSTWPSSAADRSASACCSSSCCRCPRRRPAAQLAAVRTAGAPRAGRRLPGRPAQQSAQHSGRQYVGAGRRAPGLRGLAAAPGSRLAGRPRGGRRDRSGRFPAPAAVRRLHGRRLRAGARAGAKPGRDAGTRARASPASRRWPADACGYWRNRGQPCVARRVALCNGNLPSRAFPALAAAPGYFNSPYPVSELAAGIAADATVCVIGTSLSAVDAVVALQQAGHRGPLICVSRNGRLPSVRSPHNRPPPRADRTEPRWRRRTRTRRRADAGTDRRGAGPRGAGAGRRGRRRGHPGRRWRRADRAGRRDPPFRTRRAPMARRWPRRPTRPWT